MTNLATFAYIMLFITGIYFATLFLRWVCDIMRCPKCRGKMSESYIVPGTWFCRCGEMVRQTPSKTR